MKSNNFIDVNDVENARKFRSLYSESKRSNVTLFISTHCLRPERKDEISSSSWSVTGSLPVTKVLRQQFSQIMVHSYYQLQGSLVILLQKTWIGRK